MPVAHVTWIGEIPNGEILGQLYEVVKKEKERPDSTNSNIRLDFRERKVYKDGIVLDQWNMSGF